VFNDERALGTSWEPLVRGGANFRTNRIVRVGERQLEIRKSFGAYVFGGLFVVVGAVPIVYGVTTVMHGMTGFGLLTIAFGAVFSAVGLSTAWPTTLRIDGARRCVQLKNEELAFGAISGLQILEEVVKGNKDRYTSFELNVVMRDGSRRNLMDHGDLSGLRADAATIRECLGCPLWDATVYLRVY
jgi:hypothetical protein